MPVASAAQSAGIFGHKAAAVGAVAGGLKFKEAQTSMLVADSRSGVQVAAAEGSTKKADLRAGGALFGGGAGGAVGGYGNTNEGKIIAAALMDNYNKVVTVVRNDPALQRSVGSLKQEAAAGGTKTAGAVSRKVTSWFRRLPTSSCWHEPSDTAKSLATLGRGDELVVIGAEKDGYIHVQGADGERMGEDHSRAEALTLNPWSLITNRESLIRDSRIPDSRIPDSRIRDSRSVIRD